MTYESSDLQTIGGRLRFARESYVCSNGDRLKSPREAAKHFGWNENTYKSHEGGIRQVDQLKKTTAQKYARAFGVNIEWLVLGRGTPFAKRVEQLTGTEIGVSISKGSKNV